MKRRTFIQFLSAAVVVPGALVAKSPTPKIAAFGGGRSNEALLRRMARDAKGRTALVAPYSARDVDRAYEFDADMLKRAGFRRVSRLPLDGGAAEAISAADLIWFSGGFQKRQVQTLAARSGMVKALQAAHANGTVMAGSSAGAAVMSKLMISGGRDGAVYTRAGLGFTQGLVLDQHVGERGREYRLRKVISGNRRLVGIGMDEETGVLIADGVARVFSQRGSDVRVVWWANGALQEQVLKNKDQIRVPV